jgi:hypothetical protein
MKASQRTDTRSAQRGALKTGVSQGAADFGRQQAVVANEAACALFRGLEAIFKIQQQAAHAALERHAAAVHDLASGSDLGRVMATQAKLFNSDLAASMRYWEDLATASMEMHTELAGCAAHLVDSETVLEGSAAASALPFTVPGLDAFFRMSPPFLNALGKGYQPHAEAS